MTKAMRTSTRRSTTKNLKKSSFYKLVNWLVLLLIIIPIAYVHIRTKPTSNELTELGQFILEEPNVSGTQMTPDKIRMKITENVIGTLRIANKAFQIYDNVLAQTLKQGIGWLPSSVLPPEAGACVIAGHQNTQFRILKKLKQGDRIIFEKANGTSYTFEVKKLEIWNNIDVLRFYKSQSCRLLLITCYPFYYVRDTPQKYAVTAELIKS